jgi:methionyl-tRNA formyltransferase
MGISLDNVKNLVKHGTKVQFVNDLNSVEVENSLKELQPDLIIFTGGGLIKENILNCSGRGVLNCHMGILPLYRGMDVVEWPILCNDIDNLGLTVHLMEKGVDTGPILSHRYIKPEPYDTIDSLRSRFEPFMVSLMVETSINYLYNNISPVFQDYAEGKQFFILNSKMKKIAQLKFQHFLLEKSNC